jgi:transposase InsO family protein
MRDNIIEFIEMVCLKSNYNRKQLLRLLALGKSRYYEWIRRQGRPNHHNGLIPKAHWLLPEERESILNYCRDRIGEGYRRLTYRMLDENIVAVSPSTAYRILKEAGLLKRWNPKKSVKGLGFKQPLEAHEHWHVDISYINILGTVFFLISVLDGASRYIVHHELRLHISGYDVELTIERAKDKFPAARPRIISDNGSQFVNKEFKEFIRYSGFSHVRTSVAYPQSNGKIERFHGTIKSEEIRRRSYLSHKDARNQIAKYIDYYNTERLHSAIYYLTPEDVLSGRTKQRLSERQEKLDAARKYRLERYAA